MMTRAISRQFWQQCCWPARRRRRTGALRKGLVQPARRRPSSKPCRRRATRPCSARAKRPAIRWSRAPQTVMISTSSSTSAREEELRLAPVRHFFSPEEGNTPALANEWNRRMRFMQMAVDEQRSSASITTPDNRRPQPEEFRRCGRVVGVHAGTAAEFFDEHPGAK